MTRRKLLLLSPFAPRLDATHGGGKVLAQLSSGLAARHDLSVLALRAPEEAPAGDDIQAACAHYADLPRPWAAPGQRWPRAARLLLGLALGRPLWLSDWSLPAFADLLRARLHADPPDIVILGNHIMGAYLPELAACPAARLLIVHEPGVSGAPYLKDVPPAAGRLLHALDRRAWLRYEPRLLRQLQAAVVFTPRDQEVLQAFQTGVALHCIPFGVPLPPAPLDPLGAQPPEILFTGNFIHPPNREAALRLAREIFPLVKARVPQARLVIVGPQPPAELLALASADITITGQVPEVRPYLDRAALFIAPLFSGSGMRVKVLESLAAGKALVATPLAAEGLDLQDGTHLLLGADGSALANQTVTLLENPPLRAQLAASARAWACDHLGWERVMDAYDALFDAILEESHAFAAR